MQVILVITPYMIVDSLKVIQDEQNFILENYGTHLLPMIFTFHVGEMF